MSLQPMKSNAPKSRVMMGVQFAAGANQEYLAHHETLLAHGYKHEASGSNAHHYTHPDGHSASIYGRKGESRPSTWAGYQKNGDMSKVRQHTDRASLEKHLKEIHGSGKLGAKFASAVEPDEQHISDAHDGLVKAGYRVLHKDHGHTVYHHKTRGYAVLNRSANYGSGHVHIHHPHDGGMEYNRNEVKEVFPKG